MAHTAHGIGELVTRIQHEFLDIPGLTLTSAGAQARFRLDAATCGALLDVLAEAGVLARTFHAGEYAFLLRQGARHPVGADVRPGGMRRRTPRRAA